MIWAILFLMGLSFFFGKLGRVSSNITKRQLRAIEEKQREERLAQAACQDLEDSVGQSPSLDIQFSAEGLDRKVEFLRTDVEQASVETDKAFEGLTLKPHEG